jgi:uncharacterized protein (TIGR02284 family)
MIVRTNIEELLDELVAISRDAETAFTVCAYTTRNETFSAMLFTRALVCAGAARSLSSVAGARNQKDGDRDFRRRKSGPDWLALHDALLECNDAAVRDECARIEDETLMHFRDALEHDLSANVQRVVHRYFAALLETGGRLQALTLSEEQEPRRPSWRNRGRARIARHA